MWRRYCGSYRGKHICITGGSEGLGFALASLFIHEQETQITLISRTRNKLEQAKQQLDSIIKQESLKSTVRVFTGDVVDAESIQESIRKTQDEAGAIDVLICNAGLAVPGRFVDSNAASFIKQMEVNYLGTVYSVRSVINKMIERQKGEIVFISSALGVIGMSGYASYAPTKWAVRGLADCLRMELKPHGIKVRIAYPPDMDTPGYNAELQLTPPEVLDIMKAAGDSMFKPMDVAKAILKGMKQDRYHLPSPDLLQTLSQATMSGLSPVSYWLPIQALICAVCVFVSSYFLNTFDKITHRHVKKKRS
eukprot:g6252.t1